MKLSDVGEDVWFEHLCKVVDLLDKWDIDYRLDSGTLLGAVREGGMIPHDHDIDIGCFHKDKKKALFYQMPCIESDNSTQIESDTRPPFWTQVFWKTLNRGHYHWKIFVSPTRVFKKVPRELLDEVTTVKIRDRDFKIPKRYDEYLTYRYGDWKKVKKDYQPHLHDNSIFKKQDL